jgi:Rrf2 family protein
MKLSAQEEYGLRCLLQLARHGEGASLTIADLARLEGISAPHVAKIMRILRRAGLVRSTRGQSGGYALARPAEALPVSEALTALGGPLFDASFCDRHSGLEAACAHSGDCSIRPVLVQLQIAVDQVLGRLTLRQMLCSEGEMRARAGPRSVPLPLVVRSA